MVGLGELVIIAMICVVLGGVLLTVLAVTFVILILARKGDGAHGRPDMRAREGAIGAPSATAQKDGVSGGQREG